MTNNNFNPHNYSIYLETYGCSLNIADGQTLLGLLQSKGFIITNNFNSADCVIINSCTVKNTTLLNFKKRVRELLEMGKRIVVTGCVPHVYSDEEFLKHVSFIGTRNLNIIADVVEKTIIGNTVHIINESDERRLTYPKYQKDSVVEIIPIAQGCVGKCSYCQTKLARGNLKSYPVEDIVSAFCRSISNGAKEIWLTAQDTGAYGLDLGSNLIFLLKEILKINREFKLRLGMMNPQHVKRFLNELISIFNDDRVYQFLHIPVQSGSDKIIKDMERYYTTDDLFLIADNMREKFPKIAFSTDVIVGYPGETEEDFLATLEFLRRFQPSTINRSRYSPRHKTIAAEKPQIPSKIISERSVRLGRIVEEIVSGQNKKWIGWEGEVLIDEQKKEDSFLGRNFAYKPIVVKRSDARKSIKLGDKINIKVFSTTTFHLKAKQI